MNFIKKHWTKILIVILLIGFVSKCTSSGNYKRKYNKEVERTEFVADSMKTVYSHSSHTIDSLNMVIKTQNMELSSLNSQLEIYKTQNSQLNDRNKQLAGKQVVVNIDKNK